MSSQIIVMGVSGSGKSTLGEALAIRLRLPYIEGDQLHSAASIAKMAAGIPLEDEDRWPWLDRIGQGLAIASDNGRGAVASCSALRRVYRDRLRAATGQHLRFVMIELPRDILERRMAERTGHYMPPALLDSQLRTLEPPVGESDVLVVDGRLALADMVEVVCRWRTQLLVSGETW